MASTDDRKLRFPNHLAEYRTRKLIFMLGFPFFGLGTLFLGFGAVQVWGLESINSHGVNGWWLNHTPPKLVAIGLGLSATLLCLPMATIGLLGVFNRKPYLIITQQGLHFLKVWSLGKVDPEEAYWLIPWPSVETVEFVDQHGSRVLNSVFGPQVHIRCRELNFWGKTKVWQISKRAVLFESDELIETIESTRSSVDLEK